MTTWVCAKCGTAFGEGEAQRTFGVMLAALKAAIRDLTGEDYDCPSVVTQDHSLVNQIRAAIALAEGEGT